MSSRLSTSQKAMLFGSFRACLLSGGRSKLTKRVMVKCEADFSGWVPNRNTVMMWIKKWSENDDEFTAAEKVRENLKRPRVLSDTGTADLLAAAAGSNYRRVAKKMKFEGVDGTLKRVSRETVKRWTSPTLELSEPKTTRIRHHTAHHRRFRKEIAGLVMRKPASFALNMHFSDEMSIPIAITPNKKNDVILVPKGSRSSTNIRRVTKGSDKQCFSLFWVITRHGVLTYDLYVNNFDMQFFEALLYDKVQPAIQSAKQRGEKVSVFVHDNVSNSRSYPEDALNDIYGRSHHWRHSPPICKVKSGEKQHIAYDRKDGRHIEYDRDEYVACEECECRVREGVYASASPDMNLAENAQGMLRQMLEEMIRDGDIEWRGSPKKKMELFKTVIEKLHNDKSYWKRLFESCQKRYKWIYDNDGDIYDA